MASSSKRLQWSSLRPKVTRTFTLDITRFAEKVRLRTDIVLRKVALDALNGIIRRSPVDTGRFRASHRLGINAPDLSTRGVMVNLGKTKSGKTIRKVKYGSPPRQEELLQAQATLAFRPARAGDVIFISNNLPYAMKLEQGGSPQAKNGIYYPTLVEIRGKMDQIIAGAKKEAP